MSHFLDRLSYFTQERETFSDGHGQVTREDRTWEDGYRQRWQHDKIVRSTHGVNCTGSCSWKIYVKGGIVTWETQQTDYPRTRPDLPNHEPRGCSRGASYSWYMYSANRVKYPMVRGRLLRAWREARKSLGPVEAWASIVESPQASKDYKSRRGLGGFVRSSWDEANEIIAAANVYTIKKHGPDRVVGFSPIPAMSMVSYAAGSRYLSLIGGVCMSFYDWYCDLPPASPQTWGEQTDVPESADWYNSTFIMAWGSNVPQTRTPDAHFFTEVRYKGAKIVSITPGLRRSVQARRPVAAPQAGHRCGAGDGDGACDPEGIPPRQAFGLFPGLCAPLHRPADAGEAGQARRALRAGPLRARHRFLRQARAGEQPGLEDGRLRRSAPEKWWSRTARSASAGGRPTASGIWRRRRPEAGRRSCACR